MNIKHFSLLLTPYCLLPTACRLLLTAFPAFLARLLSRLLRHVAYCLLLTTFLFTLAVPASADVTVFDTVSSFNETIKLKALTKGRFFPEGGKLVTYHVDGIGIGTTLSGGDGYAFMKYKSTSSGIKILKVESGEDTDEGVLLITGKKDRVILIEIENALFDSMLSFKPVKKSKEVLKELSKKFRILYISSLVGVEQSRKWLKDNEFPFSPVLKWEGKELIDYLKEKHILLYAIIASPDLLSEASEIEKRFSLTETEDASAVKDWDELIKKLK
jgi:hypothetical protein